MASRSMYFIGVDDSSVLENDVSDLRKMVRSNSRGVRNVNFDFFEGGILLEYVTLDENICLPLEERIEKVLFRRGYDYWCGKYNITKIKE